MSTSKKISQLNTKTSLNDNDKFLIVDSVASDNKSVTALTIKNYVSGSGGGGNTLIFNYSQFVANAGVVYPLGTVIYYRDASGRVTGVHKVADGINTLANLPLRVSEYSIFNDIGVKDCSDFAITIGKNTASRFVKSTHIPPINVANASIVSRRWDFILIDIPIYVYSLSMYIGSYSSPGDVAMGIYSVDPNNYNGSLVAGSGGVINITSVGRKTLDYSPPILLEPGGYYLYISVSSSSFGWMYVNTTLHRGLLISGNYYKEGVILSSYSAPTPTIGPLNSASYAKLLFEIEYLPAI